MSSDPLRIGAIVQARLGSQRLPGKVLRVVQGKPLLQYTLERVRQVRRLDRIVVATSSDASDDPLAEWCKSYGIDCLRGSLHDVAGRFVQTLQQYKFDAFVRVNGDSPLIDHRLIERGVDQFEARNCDIATNVFPKTYPNGESVEVVCAGTFLEAYPQFRNEADREHVTPYFYAHPHEFRIENFAKSTPCRDCEFAVDTPRHLQELEAMLAAMSRDHREYDVEELIALHRSVCAPATVIALNGMGDEVKPCRG
jgi:spore coat polysaccharide biosynthesis protein SpsF